MIIYIFCEKTYEYKVCVTFNVCHFSFPCLVRYVDIDEFQDLAADHEIQGVPTVLFYKDGKQIDKIVGFDPNKLTALIEKHEN